MRIETPTGTLEVPGTIRSVNKGNREQMTPMAPELAPILAGWLTAHPGKGYEPLIHYTDGRPYRVGTIERFTRLWGSQAAVANCTPHRFRHTYATEMLRKGVPLEVIQKLLGHSSISTTQIYAQVGDASLVAAILTRTGSQPEQPLEESA
jgi:integrase